MADVEIRRFEEADESRMLDFGRFELVTIGGLTVGCATYEPGWVLSEHVGAATGESLCMVEHVGLVVSGRTGGWRTGPSTSSRPATCSPSPPGHDSWVIGDEPYVSLHFLGASDYAKRDER